MKNNLVRSSNNKINGRIDKNYCIAMLNIVKLKKKRRKKFYETRT